MSLKLLKQSLDVIDEPASDSKDKQSKSKTLPQSGKLSGPERSESKGHTNLSFKSCNKGKKNIDDIRKELLPDQNKTNLNLKRLLALSQNTLNAGDAKKIIKRSKKKDTMKLPKNPKALKSIFTEEDFLAFEREYFPTNT